MKRFTLILTLSLFVHTSAVAFNYREMRNAPIAWFNDRDIEMMTETFGKAMENNADGESSEWKNADTGHHGKITPLSTFQENERNCRTAQIENHAGSNYGATRLKFCNIEGSWQVTE